MMKAIIKLYTMKGTRGRQEQQVDFFLVSSVGLHAGSGVVCPSDSAEPGTAGAVEGFSDLNDAKARAYKASIAAFLNSLVSITYYALCYYQEVRLLSRI